MKEETRQSVLEFLKDNPGATYSDLDRGLPVRRSTIRLYIIELEGAGLVERVVPKSRRERHRFVIVDMTDVTPNV